MPAELPRQSNYATHTKVAGISDAQDQHQANRKKGRPQSAIFTRSVDILALCIV